MEVTKRILGKELNERLTTGKLKPDSADSLVDAVLELVKEHIDRGDRINIQEFSVRAKGDRRGSSRRSSGERRKKTGSENHFVSSNFFLNELYLMATDWSYLARKTMYFIRKAVAVSAVVILFYVITMAIGC